MCALSQLKSCQGAGAYKLQARDKRQPFLCSCFPLHLSCSISLSYYRLFFHHHASINQTANIRVVGVIQKLQCAIMSLPDNLFTSRSVVAVLGEPV